MSKTISAVFDGVSLRPDEPLGFPPNTRVHLTIESTAPPGDHMSFLETARDLVLDGPPDWSLNLEKYLYGGEPHPHR